MVVVYSSIYHSIEHQSASLPYINMDRQQTKDVDCLRAMFLPVAIAIVCLSVNAG